MCFCDKPDCERQPCKDLREYRIAYRVISQLCGVPEHGIESIDDVLDWLRIECEILVK